jgi:hypothetical protein
VSIPLLIAIQGIINGTRILLVRFLLVFRHLLLLLLGLFFDGIDLIEEGV